MRRKPSLQWMRGIRKSTGQVMPRAPRLSILLALACALFIRALVPAGWMPAETGAFAIQPCPAADPAPAVHMAGHHHGKAHHDPAHGASHNGDCAFSPFSTAFASTHQPVVAVSLVAIARPAFTLQRGADLKTGPPALPPPARGPPALA